MLAYWNHGNILLKGYFQEINPIISNLPGSVIISKDAQDYTYCTLPFYPGVVQWLGQYANISYTLKCKDYIFHGDFVDLYANASQLYAINKLYYHQWQALFESLKFSSYGLLMETGAGKTLVAIKNMEYRFRFNQAKRFLVVAKPILVNNWIRELKQWCPFLLPIPLASGTISKRAKVLDKYANHPGVVFITFYEAVGYKKPKTINDFPMANKLKEYTWDGIILDESQKIRNIDTARTQMILELGKSVPYRLILTGTLVTERPQDAWSQMNFLNPEILGFNSIRKLINYYSVIDSWGNPLFYKNLESLREKVAAQSIRVLKSDCLDLPDKYFERVEFLLPQEIADLYDRFKDEEFVQIDNETVLTSSVVITKLLRFSQVTSGHFTQSNPKLDWVMEFLDSCEHDKITIWYRFDDTRKLLLNRFNKLKSPIFVVKGGMGINKLTLEIDAFINNSGGCILLAQEQTAGEGITLTCSHNIIFYENSFSMDTYKQKQDRHHRIGTVNKVNYYNLVYPKTVDDAILKALDRKQILADQITGDVFKKMIEGTI